jgi:hypothetical protein
VVLLLTVAVVMFVAGLIAGITLAEIQQRAHRGE